MTPAAFNVSTMRVGPSRLISTALSSGESNATAAAEWITMSQLGHDVAVLGTEPETVGADVAGDCSDPACDHRLERLGGVLQFGAQAVEGVVLEDLAADPFGDVVALARPDQQHQLALRNGAQQPLDQGGTDESGASRDGDALVGEVLTDHSD